MRRTATLLVALWLAAVTPLLAPSPGAAYVGADPADGESSRLVLDSAFADGFRARRPPAGSGQPRSQATTPVEHVISLMQENHSFDNYFGTYPGADGIPPGTCMPVDARRPQERCIKPLHIGGRAVEDLSHSGRTFRRQYRNGRMDGFVDAIRREGGEIQDLVMGHYDDRDLPYYWNVADEYVLFDRFFTSAHGGSLANHMYWISAAAGPGSGESVPPGGFRGHPTIFDRLEERGVSWKFYIQNYDPRITFRSKTLGDRGSQVVWAPLLAYARFVDDPRLFKKIVPMEEFYTDLRRGTLPAVSYVVPSGSSEHPPGSIKAGETFVRGITTALMRSSAWRSSLLIWTYDDWGGWYDHVKPPRVDRHGYGFRAPALMVSPWAKRGHIEHGTMDFTSILRFIEDNWGLRPLATRDRRANSIAAGLDFESPPREATLLSRDRNVVPPEQPRRMAVYIGYSAATALALLVILLVRASERRGRCRAADGAPPAPTSEAEGYRP